MVFPSPIAAVVFDMDGLLLDTERIYVAALIEAAARLKIEVSEAFCHSMIGVPGPECDAMMRKHFGVGFPLDAFKRAFDTRRNDLLSGGVPVKPGVSELLQHLEASGLPKAIATTSSRRTAERYLQQVGLLERFPTLVTREDVTRTKPHPEAYLKAAFDLGVPPAHCVVLEDSPRGIRAAHAAGTMPILVPDLLPPTDEVSRLCVAVVADLHEVRRLLQTPAA